MDERASILNQLEASHQLVKYLVADVSDDEACRLPTPRLAPIIWQVGHLAFGDQSLCDLGGGTSPVMEGYRDLFGIWAGEGAHYPGFATVVDAFDVSHQSLVRFATTANFATSLSALPQYFNTLGEMLIFISTHRAYHAGKVGTLRSLLGMPAIWTASRSVDLLMTGLVL